MKTIEEINKERRERNKRNKDIAYTEIDGCFICISHTIDKDGYAKMKFDGKYSRVYRFIYQECHGPIPKNHVIRHKCDNRGCINPEHLEAGTHKQNMRDMRKRGRSARGEKNAGSKLTADQVKEIFNSSEKYSDISSRFNISCTQIFKIKNKICWAHVTRGLRKCKI